jgi:3-deoxy-7-phosphoheptulonate synthase
MHRGFIPRIVVDASHGNSEKDHRKQAAVIEDVVAQVVSGSIHVAGFMYESYLKAGNQPIPQDLSELLPDTSVTDGCDDIATTATVLRSVHQALAARPRK